MDRGQITFMTKALVFIASIIAFSIVIYQFSSFMRTTVEQKDYARLRSSAHNTMHNLISREECLAYSDNGVYKGVIDVEKLENFTSSYAGIEPECAESLNFDYQVEVRALETDLTTYQEVGRIPNIFEEILNSIDGSNVDFILDISASMTATDVGEVGLSRMECARNFLKSFVREMQNESHLGLMEYNCSHNRVFEFTQLEGNREHLKGKIDDLVAMGGTDLGTPLNRSFSYIHESPIAADYIVFLTDGEPWRWYDDIYLPENEEVKEYYGLEDGDSLCKLYNYTSYHDNVTEVALDYKDDIPVHTIAFGDDADPVIMERVANITGGDFYETDICEEMVPEEPAEVLDFELPAESWLFGVDAFSEADVRRSEVTYSVPVSLRYGPDNTRKAVIELRAVSGALETISSLLQRTCRQAETEDEVRNSITTYTEYPIGYLEGSSELCMAGSEDICKKIDCPVPIDFDDIDTAGEYNILFEYDESEGEVVVST